MRDEAKYGTIWKDDDLDIIVADYFAMLVMDLAGKPYVKARHSAEVMKTSGRSHRSVEFKHQNISAVLEAMGLPWIPGYRPKKNYQNAIFDAIDRFLSVHPGFLQLAQQPPHEVEDSSSIFVPQPGRSEEAKEPERLQQLVRKFDPVERDHRNRALGKAGEAFVFSLERKRLEEAGRQDLAERVSWIAEDEGDGAGFDILSFEPTGSELQIEVKTTNGASKTPFYLSRNEYRVSLERPDKWRIYRVHLFAKTPRVFTVFPPLEETVFLRPESWRASF